MDMLTSKTYLKRDTTTENWSQINEDMQFCFSVYGGSHLWTPPWKSQNAQ